MNSWWCSELGSGTKRGTTWFGTWTTASRVAGSGDTVWARRHAIKYNGDCRQRGSQLKREFAIVIG
jgi:hypothetical protein